MRNKDPSCRVYEEISIFDRELVIREPCRPRDYRELMDVQIKIWGMPGYLEAVTYHMIIAGHRHGGVVLGLFDKQTGEAVGLLFSIPGYRDGQHYLYSHLFGFVPELRGKGLGEKLKKWQRKLALEKGYVLYRWTYDPLQSSNAYFNIVKNGVIVRRFKPNYYGEMEDEINMGMPSDRFEAEWWIASRRVELAMEKKLAGPTTLSGLKAENITRTRIEDGIPVLIDYDLGLRNDVLVAEIPYSLTEVRKRSVEELLRWRLGLREVFEEYINRLGYTVVWFIVERKEIPRSYYVLWRRSLDLILSGELP